MSGPLSPNGKGQETRAVQYIDWAVRVIIVAGIVFAFDINSRLAIMESQLNEGARFTQEEGDSLEMRLRSGYLQSDHALETELKAWTESRFPPVWLREDLNEIKSAVSVLPAISTRLQALEQRVRELETK